MVSTQFGLVVKSLRLGGGTDFSSSQLGFFALKLGKFIEMNTPYSLEQNGRAERSIGVIASRVRAVCIDQKLSKFLWSELMFT